MKINYKVFGLSICLIVFSLNTISQNNNISFPYQLKSKKELALGLSGIIITGIPIVFPGDKPHLTETDILNLNRTDINPIDRFATQYFNTEINSIREAYEPIVNVASVLTIVSYSYLFQKNEHNQKFLTLGTIYLEGLLISHGTLLATKTYIDRNRPYTYNSELSIGARTNSSANKSFISGNATTVFYNSVFISKILTDLYPDKSFTKWVWIGSLSLATTSGIFSVISGSHFPTDVITGALIGGMCGYFIPEFHKINSTISVLPYFNFNTQGLVLSYSF